MRDGAGHRPGRRHHGAVGLHGHGRAAPDDARGRRRKRARCCSIDQRAAKRAVAGAEGDARRRRRRLQARRAPELSRDDGRQHEPDASSSTCIFAGIIAFGVVYNAARVSLSERSRELASLRVLGFTRAEISLILLGELALLTLAALPVGALFGYGLSAAIVQIDRQRGLPVSAVRLAPGRGAGPSSASSPRRSSRGCSCGASSTRSIWWRC